MTSKRGRLSFGSPSPDGRSRDPDLRKMRFRDDDRNWTSSNRYHKSRLEDSNHRSTNSKKSSERTPSSRNSHGVGTPEAPKKPKSFETSKEVSVDELEDLKRIKKGWKESLDTLKNEVTEKNKEIAENKKEIADHKKELNIKTSEINSLKKKKEKEGTLEINKNLNKKIEKFKEDMAARFKTIQKLKTKIKSLEAVAKTKEPVVNELIDETNRYKQERNEAEKQYIALKEDFLSVKKEAKKEKAARLSLNLVKI